MLIHFVIAENGIDLRVEIAFQWWPITVEFILVSDEFLQWNQLLLIDALDLAETLSTQKSLALNSLG